MNGKAIVLDANILIRAVLGQRVRHILFEHAQNVKFFAPDVAYADARKYLPALLEKRGVNGAAALRVLDTLESIVRPLEFDLYAGLQHQALQRIGLRDDAGLPGMDRGCRLFWHRRGHLDQRPSSVVFGGVTPPRFLVGTPRGLTTPMSGMPMCASTSLPSARPLARTCWPWRGRRRGDGR